MAIVIPRGTVPERAESLGVHIADLAGELQHDLAQADRKHAFTEIHQLRRSLVSLEHELLEDVCESHGDAC